MNRQRRITLWLAAVVAIAMAGTTTYLRASSPEADSAQGEKSSTRFIRDAVPVPSFVSLDLEGRTISPAQWQGKVVLVNFWATWCPPCRAEFPMLIRLQDKYRDQLQIVGVSEDEGSSEPVRRFAADFKINYPIVRANPEVRRAFPTGLGLPRSFILDRDTRVVQRHIGLLNEATVEDEIRALAGLP
jgi:thiol-disulfide isomerase/thioredoxin